MSIREELQQLAAVATALVIANFKLIMADIDTLVVYLTHLIGFCIVLYSGIKTALVVWRRYLKPILFKDKDHEQK